MTITFKKVFKVMMIVSVLFNAFILIKSFLGTNPAPDMGSDIFYLILSVSAFFWIDVSGFKDI